MRAAVIVPTIAFCALFAVLGLLIDWLDRRLP